MRSTATSKGYGPGVTPPCAPASLRLLPAMFPSKSKRPPEREGVGAPRSAARPTGSLQSRGFADRPRGRGAFLAGRFLAFGLLRVSARILRRPDPGAPEDPAEPGG